MQIVEHSRNVHKYVKGFLTILLILFYSSVFSQTKIDEAKRKQFYEQWKIYSLDITKAEECGKKMLQLSQDDYERSLSYNLLAEKLLADLNYVKSIEFLEKAQVFSKNIDSTQQYMRVTGTLISAYRKAGLILESDKNWELFQKLSENLPESSRDVNLLFIRAHMFDVDKNHCSSANTREKFMNVAGKMLGEGPAKNTFVFAIMVQIVYDQIKCGKISEAKKSMLITEENLKNIDQTKNVMMSEFYLLDKALFAVLDKNKEAAKKLFDSAYAQSLKVNTISIQKIILEERLDADIDNAEDQLKFAKLLNTIMNKEVTSTKKITSVETNKALRLIKESENRELLFKFGLGAILVAFVLVGLFYYRRNKRLKATYLQIINELENPIKTVDEQNEVLSDVKVDVIKNDETEQEILKNLVSFEKKRLFVTKGISTAQMAVMLKTNTKYLNYVLKKYRDSDSYNYINTQRINYIVRELHDKPELLQYKIAVLSDMCGYNSHSQFASIFKAVKDISPSQYISFLSAEAKTKSVEA